MSLSFMAEGASLQSVSSVPGHPSRLDSTSLVDAKMESFGGNLEGTSAVYGILVPRPRTLLLLSFVHTIRVELL